MNTALKHLWTLVSIIIIAPISLKAGIDDVMRELALAKDIETLSPEARQAIDDFEVLYDELNPDLQKSLDSLKEKKSLFRKLWSATQNNDAQEIDLLVFQGADVNQLTPQGSLLSGAVLFNNTAAVQKLLAHKAKLPNKADRVEERTLVHNLLENNSLDLLNVLLDSGIDTELVNQYGETALLLAVKNGSPEVVKTLLEHGASTEIVDKQGNTPVLLAIKRGNVEGDIILNLLIAHKADLNKANTIGRAPLRVALDTQAFDCVNSLVLSKVDLAARDQFGFDYMRRTTEEIQNHKPQYVNALKALVVGNVISALLQDPIKVQAANNWIVRNIITFKKELGVAEHVRREIFYNPYLGDELLITYLSNLRAGNPMTSDFFAQAKNEVARALLGRIKEYLFDFKVRSAHSIAMGAGTMSQSLLDVLDPAKVKANFEQFTAQLIEKKRIANRYARTWKQKQAAMNPARQTIQSSSNSSSTNN